MFISIYSLTLHSVLKAFSLASGPWLVINSRCLYEDAWEAKYSGWCRSASSAPAASIHSKSLMWQGPNILPTTNCERVARWCGMLQAKNCSCWLSPTHQGLFSLIKPQVLTNFDSNWNTNYCLQLLELNIFIPIIFHRIDTLIPCICSCISKVHMHYSWIISHITYLGLLISTSSQIRTKNLFMKDFSRWWNSKIKDQFFHLSKLISLQNFCFEKFLTKVQCDCWPWILETLTICWIVLAC